MPTEDLTHLCSRILDNQRYLRGIIGAAYQSPRSVAIRFESVMQIGKILDDLPSI